MEISMSVWELMFLTISFVSFGMMEAAVLVAVFCYKYFTDTGRLFAMDWIKSMVELINIKTLAITWGVACPSIMGVLWWVGWETTFWLSVICYPLAIVIPMYRRYLLKKITAEEENIQEGLTLSL